MRAHRIPPQARSKFEVFVTVLMLVVALALASAAARAYLHRTSVVPIEPPVPSQPVSLSGAAVSGDPAAPLAIVEYADFQCPACGTFSRNTLPVLETRYVSSGKVLLAFRNLPLSSIHPLALLAGQAAACAGRQGLFWPMHDLLYREQGRLADEDLREKARRLELDEARFDACLHGDDTLTQIRLDAGEGLTLAVTGTPTLFLGKNDHAARVTVLRRVSGAQTIDQLVPLIDGLLRDIGTRKAESTARRETFVNQTETRTRRRQGKERP